MSLIRIKFRNICFTLVFLYFIWILFGVYKFINTTHKLKSLDFYDIYKFSKLYRYVFVNEEEHLKEFDESFSETDLLERQTKHFNAYKKQKLRQTLNKTVKNEYIQKFLKILSIEEPEFTNTHKNDIIDMLESFVDFNTFGKEANTIKTDKVNKKIRNKDLTINRYLTNIYSVDTCCYWHRAHLKLVPLTYTHKYLNKLDFCNENNHLITNSTNKQFNKAFMNHLISTIFKYRKELNIYNDLFPEYLPVNKTINGGAWFPFYSESSSNKRFIFKYSASSDCIPMERIAVIVAVDRLEEKLHVFLTYIHYYLQKQMKSYKIFVIEQENQIDDGIIFNKGRLYNAGYKQAIKDSEWEFNCIMFHDIDLLPVRVELNYSCYEMPTQFVLNINNIDDNRTFTQHKFFKNGVLSIQPKHFELVNGFSNEYFGYENDLDFLHDDFSIRINLNDLCILTPLRNESSYVMLGYRDYTSPYSKKWDLLSGSQKFLDSDGLTNIDQLVKIKHVVEYNKFTHVYLTQLTY